MTINPMQLLICGSAENIPSDERDERATVLVGLGRLVSSYYDFSIDFAKNLESPQSSYFLPVSLRSLMETSTIALLARIDPLRVIHSSKSQDNANYNKSRQQASALKWKGDIIGDDATPTPPAENKAAKQVWDPNISSQKLPRALLSEQSCEALWTPAAKNATKWLGNNFPRDSNWCNELINAVPEEFQRQTVGTGNRLYSELSKGIHPEFTVRREAEFDSSTLKNSLENSIKWTATLAFISHFSSGISVGLTPEQTLEAFISVEGSVK